MILVLYDTGITIEARVCYFVITVAEVAMNHILFGFRVQLGFVHKTTVRAVLHTHRFQGRYPDISLILNIINGSNSSSCGSCGSSRRTSDITTVATIVSIGSPRTGRKFCACRISLCSLRPLVQTMRVKLKMIIISFIYDFIIIGVAVICGAGIATRVAIVSLERTIVFIV